jgi:hypothetical protein
MLPCRAVYRYYWNSLYNAKCNNSVNGLCSLEKPASPDVEMLQDFALGTLGYRNVPLVQVG